jgi:ATP-binding cassette subfamily B protein
MLTRWHAQLQSQLEQGEEVLAWFETDLDEQLVFTPGFIALTSRRLLSTTPTRGGPVGMPPRWQSWLLTNGVTLRTREQGGVGSLEVLGDNGRLAHFRYTPGRAEAASRLVQRREAFLAEQRGEAALSVTVCPTCGAVITSPEGVCAACAAERQAPPVWSLLRLKPYAARHARLILLGIVLTFVSTGVSLLPSYLIKGLLDDVLIPQSQSGGADFSLVWVYLAALAGTAVFTWLTDWGRVWVLNFASEFITADLRLETYAHLQRLSLEYFGGKRTGDLISRINSDTGRLCNFLSLSVVDFFADCVLMILAAGLMLQVDARLALVTLLPFPFIVVLSYWVRGRLLRHFRRAGVAESELTSILADTVPGIRVVKAFGQERREVERFGESNARLLHANNQLNVLWSFFSPMVSLVTGLGVLVVWAYASHLVFTEGLTAGVIVFFVSVIARFYARVESMIRMVSSVQRAASSAQRVFEILDKVPSVPEPACPVHPGRLEGRVELKDVRFKYGPREVLHGINLTIEPGEMIGLVGPSGAGKSTLINLICRFYDVAAGFVHVDGTDVRKFAVEEYRQNIGVVLQDPFLFFGTVAENIAYGRPGASRAEIVRAARAAHAHEFILRLPSGYDSLVGERGQSLSGGERQRVAIARALLIDPRLLILDEATSSVDTETEREIQAALDNLVRGRTTIAIAHRLSTLRRANRLVVVEAGRIVEVGTHDTLLADPAGVYSRLHRAQQQFAEGHAV